MSLAPQLPAHTRAEQSERQMRLQCAEPRLGQRVAGGGIAHHAHRVPATRLLGGEIADMAEEPARRERAGNAGCESVRPRERPRPADQSQRS